MRHLQEWLKLAEERHGHLCAGQVLGVRMALGGLAWLDIDPEREPKRLLAFVEIDRCAADAIGAVTGCRLGKRNLKYVDYGKMAATFIDLETGRAVRVAALDSARRQAWQYVPAGTPKGEAQLIAYQAMPDDELFVLKAVLVELSACDLPGPPLRRVACARCGEGISDGREVLVGDEALCRACAAQPYYMPVSEARAVPAASITLAAGSERRPAAAWAGTIGALQR